MHHFRIDAAKFGLKHLLNIGQFVLKVNESMSQEDYEQFQKLVLQDLSLQKRLRSVTERQEFIKQVVDLAKENGCLIATEEVQEALRRSRRLWLERWI